MEEYWKPISGFDGIYEVSNLGRIKSLDRIAIGKDGTASKCLFLNLKHVKGEINEKD